MSVLDQVRAVLRWAGEGRGAAPPRFEPGPIDELLAPPQQILGELGAFGAAHAARLGWQVPLDDDTPPGPGALVVAAAVGLSRPEVAVELLACCAALTGTWDLLLRDAIAGPALAAGPAGDAAEALRLTSPLSAALERPGPGQQPAAFALLDRLRGGADGRRMLIAAFATPGAGRPLGGSPQAGPGNDGAPGSARAVRRFREDCLERLRLAGLAGRDLVFEIYEAAFTHHRAATLAEVHAAAASLSGRQGPGAGADMIDDARAVAAFFGPLWRLRRAFPDELRRRPYLDVQAIIETTRLYDLAARLTGGAP